MADRLGDVDTARLERQGIRALTPDQGLELLAAAAARPNPHLVAARWDLATLRSRARAGTLPPVLTGLVPTVRPTATATTTADAGADLRARLAGLTTADQQRVVLDVILRSLATVLGHSGGDDIDPDEPFEKVGLDSLSTVQIRNHLATATGLGLSMTAIYDYPTPSALAAHLRERMAPPAAGADLPMDDVRRLLRSARLTRPGDGDLVAALLNLVGDHASAGGTTAAAQQKAISEMGADDLIAMGLDIAKRRRGDA